MRLFQTLSNEFHGISVQTNGNIPKSTMNKMELKNFIAKNEKDMLVELMTNQCVEEFPIETVKHNSVIVDEQFDTVNE